MEKLPQPLLQTILGFAVPGYAEDIVPAKRTETKEILKELTLVAKAWCGPLRVISRQYEQSTLTLVFRTTSRQDLSDMYHGVETRGKNVTEIYVCMGTIANYMYSRKFHMRPGLKRDVAGVWIDWCRIFANLPELKVLNLSEMPLDSLDIVAVLDAVSTHCLKLESLTLPYSENKENEESIREVLQKLYEALERWRVKGNLGGLRRLRVPTRASADPFRMSEEFFKNVMINCPQVEYLDGYKM